MENKETIAFTASLLLLVISIGISPLLPEGTTTAVSTLLCMVSVGLTTLLDTLSQQKHKISDRFKKAHISISVVLVISIIIAKFMKDLLVVQYVVVGFLIMSVVVSMLITHQTRPNRQFKHLENSNKVFALTFLIIVPTYLLFHFAFESTYEQFQIGFLLYTALTALAIRKIYDDLHRLSLVENGIKVQEQKFKNYGLTEREKEIAGLLFQGFTYQGIADQLFISMPTVKTHASNIYRKCNVKTRNELTRLLSC